jgi:hypothetical protein
MYQLYFPMYFFLQQVGSLEVFSIDQQHFFQFLQSPFLINFPLTIYFYLLYRFYKIINSYNNYKLSIFMFVIFTLRLFHLYFSLFYRINLTIFLLLYLNYFIIYLGYIIHILFYSNILIKNLI